MEEKVRELVNSCFAYTSQDYEPKDFDLMKESIIKIIDENDWLNALYLDPYIECCNMWDIIYSYIFAMIQHMQKNGDGAVSAMYSEFASIVRHTKRLIFSHDRPKDANSGWRYSIPRVIGILFGALADRDIFYLTTNFSGGKSFTFTKHSVNGYTEWPRM